MTILGADLVDAPTRTLPDTMKAATVQLSIVDGDPEANYARVRQLLDGAPGAGLYLLPELWTSGYATDRWDAIAAESTPEIARRLRDLAASRTAWIGGTMITRREDGLVNRFWLFRPDGGEPVTYDKAHLFPLMDEDALLRAGAERVRVELGPLTAGLSVCYDLRFPAMYRRDAREGAGLFLVPAEWPYPRCEPLRLLARARAVENHAYLVLSNRVGTDAAGTRFCGGSMIVEPGGGIAADAGHDEGVAMAELEPGLVARARAWLPVLDAEVDGVDR